MSTEILITVAINPNTGSMHVRTAGGNCAQPPEVHPLTVSQTLAKVEEYLVRELKMLHNRVTTAAERTGHALEGRA